MSKYTRKTIGDLPIKIHKSRICLMCGMSYLPKNGSQKFCGSYSNKESCSWKNYINLCKKKSKLQHIKRNLIPFYHRNSHMKSKYGITQDEYIKLSDKQNGVCGICGSNETGYQTQYMYIDHSHTTGKVRGLLCNKCNFGLGNFKDNVEILQKAINYLKENE